MSDLFGPVCPCCGQPMPDKQQSRPFDAFWTVWPDKRGKEPAQKAWKRLTPPERQVAVDRCEAWCRDWRKRNPEASHIMAATYLNQRRFLDMPETAKPATIEALDMQAGWIRERKAYLCKGIRHEAVRQMIERGLVTAEDCRAVGL